MKKYHLIPLLLISIGLQASHIKKLALVGASATAAYPFLRAAYDWNYAKQHLNEWSKELEDVDPVVAKAARAHLKKQGYANASTIMLKAGGPHAMQALCDGMIVFSAQHVKLIKKALVNPNQADSASTLSVFKHDLDHEMFHISDQHAKKSIAANVWLPSLVEFATLPITYKLLQTKNTKLFTLGIIASIPTKYEVNWLLNLLHIRNQEYRAEMTAIKKCYDTMDLYNVGLFRKEILEKGMMTRLAENFAGDNSNSLVLPILMKFFGQKIDFDLDRANSDKRYKKEQISKATEIYNKFHDQPYHWPLRVMSLEQDSEHPFVLDVVKQIQKRIEKIQDLK